MTPTPYRLHPGYDTDTQPPATGGCAKCWRFWHFSQKTDFRADAIGRRAYANQQILPDREDR
jgi:hypothetical protein